MVGEKRRNFIILAALLGGVAGWWWVTASNPTNVELGQRAGVHVLIMGVDSSGPLEMSGVILDVESGLFAVPVVIPEDYQVVVAEWSLLHGVEEVPLLGYRPSQVVFRDVRRGITLLRKGEGAFSPWAQAVNWERTSWRIGEPIVLLETRSPLARYLSSQEADVMLSESSVAFESPSLGAQILDARGRFVGLLAIPTPERKPWVSGQLLKESWAQYRAESIHRVRVELWEKQLRLHSEFLAMK